MARLGFRTVDEMIGRSDRLEQRRDVNHWKARGVDLSRLLHRPELPAPRPHAVADTADPAHSLDATRLLARCRPALEEGKPVRATIPIRNVHRTVGTILGSEVTRRYGAEGLPTDTIRLRFTGSAGQSFGAFAPPGVTLIVVGDTNDYVGKGLSGGRIIVVPPAAAAFDPAANIIVGNVAFYGATAGEAYIYGMAGERFCVRNSGVHAVVEAVGDHGCEYMTGGRVVVLGRTGRNFAAGMTGGVAYVLDETGDFPRRCNLDMVDLEPLDDPAEIGVVRSLIRRHAILTGSERARAVLRHWRQSVPCFVRVIPRDYRRMLQAIADARAAGASGDTAVMAAFRANKEDTARISGN
jgi:glutamate synthase (ferredoxin)